MRVREHFDKKADDYFSHYYLSGVKNCHIYNQQVRLKYFKELIKNCNICHKRRSSLDIGCGPGSITIELKRFGFSTFGIDISYKMLLNNRKNNGNEVKLAQCSGDLICFKDNSFDIVTAAGVLEYVEKDKRMLDEILRILKPGGFMLISVPIEKVVSSNLKWFIWKYVLKKESDNFCNRSYRPGNIRETVRNVGFNIIKTIPHHFVFFPVDYFFPNFSQKLDNSLKKLLKNKFFRDRLGKTYIIYAEKPNGII